MYHIQETTYTRELYHMYVPYTRDYVHTRVISQEMQPYLIGIRCLLTFNILIYTMAAFLDFQFTQKKKKKGSYIKFF
jgi:hypothetical protein